MLHYALENFPKIQRLWGPSSPPTHSCKPQLMLSHLNKSYSQHIRHRTQADKLQVVCFHRRWEGRKAHEMVLGMLTMSFRGKKTQQDENMEQVHGASGLGFCPAPLPISLPLQASGIPGSLPVSP